jgi:hypothetical protein
MEIVQGWRKWNIIKINQEMMMNEEKEKEKEKGN